ncbi:MAG: SMP-30/gluconolactonase/LRE family protein [Sulfitobacter sp.]
MTAFDTHPCHLGEGPLWHPALTTLFWFDILENSLFSRSGDDLRQYHLDEHFSAAGWVDDDTLIIASETALWLFDIARGTRTHLTALEADNPVTRSNDGRADPWGGFWIGTMGKSAEANAGAIYRYYRGELRKLVGDITISNAICFAPDRSHAYYTDTPTRQVMRVALDTITGWPKGDPAVFIDLNAEGLNPDGAVTDADGNIWIACWGAGRVACYDPDGTALRHIDVPAQHPTCPAFGGADLRDLYVTSAKQGLDKPGPKDGMTFCFKDVAQGLLEPRVIL